jgi:hypothetical protein
MSAGHRREKKRVREREREREIETHTHTHTHTAAVCALVIMAGDVSTEQAFTAQYELAGACHAHRVKAVVVRPPPQPPNPPPSFPKHTPAYACTHTQMLGRLDAWVLCGFDWMLVFDVSLIRQSVAETFLLKKHTF